MKLSFISLILAFIVSSPVFAMTCLNRDLNEILVVIKIDQKAEQVAYSDAAVYGSSRGWTMNVDFQIKNGQITEVKGRNQFLLKLTGQVGRDLNGNAGQRALLSGKGIPGSANEMVCR